MVESFSQNESSDFISLLNLDANKSINEQFLESVKGITDLFVSPSMINIELHDLKESLSLTPMTVISTGSVTGENRARQAIEQALAISDMKSKVKIAKSVLINISASDIQMEEFAEVGSVLIESVSNNTIIKMGMSVNQIQSDSMTVALFTTYE